MVVNLFAYRSPSPMALRHFKGDPIGPSNDAYIQAAACESALVICAWGANGAYQKRGAAVLDRLRELLAISWESPKCLRMTASGFPEHPLYLPSILVPVEIPCEE